MDVLPSEVARNLRDVPTPFERKANTRLRAKVAGRIYPVLHTWEGGFSIAAEGSSICAVRLIFTRGIGWFGIA